MGVTDNPRTDGVSWTDSGSMPTISSLYPRKRSKNFTYKSAILPCHRIIQEQWVAPWNSWSDPATVSIYLQPPWQCPRAFALSFHANSELDPFSTPPRNRRSLCLSRLSLLKHPLLLLVKVIIWSIFLVFRRLILVPVCNFEHVGLDSAFLRKKLGWILGFSWERLEIGVHWGEKKSCSYWRYRYLKFCRNYEKII